MKQLGEKHEVHNSDLVQTLISLDELTELDI